MPREHVKNEVIMPWFSEKSDRISPKRIQELIQRAADEAKSRLCKHPRRVLLLPPDITRAHSKAGQMTEMLYSIFAREADVHVIPTLGQHVPHTTDENRRMFGSIPEERIHAHDWRGGCVKVGEIPADFVKQTTKGGRRLAVPHRAQSNVDGGAMGPDYPRGPRGAARGFGICQPQQKLFHRPGRQGIDLRLAHGGRPAAGSKITWARWSRLCASASTRPKTTISAACPTFTCKSSWPEMSKANWSTRAFTWATIWKPICTPPAVAPAKYHGPGKTAGKSSLRHAGRRILQHLGGQQGRLPHAHGIGRRRRTDHYRPGPEASWRTTRGGRHYPQIRLLRDSQGDGELPPDPVLQDFAHATAHLIHGSSEGRFKITYAPGHMSKAEIEGVNFGMPIWAKR